MALNINIHTPNGLVPISPELTYKLIVDVLGYTPLDASNYVTYDSISDVDNSAFYVVDSQLHILAQIDEDGLQAAIMTVNGKDVESGLIYDIKELADDAFYIVDSQSNVIAKIGENGLETTNVIAQSIITNSIESADSELYIVDTNNRPILSVDANGLETTNIVATDAVLSLHSVVDHIEDYEIHITEEERQSWNSKSKFDSISEDDNTTLYINDKNNKTIAKFDADGLTVTNVSTNDVTVGGDKSVLSHINNTSIHITDAERSTWNTVTSKASKAALNEHINDTDKHLGDEISLDDNTTLYINDKDNKTIVKVNSEGLTAAEVILQSDKELHSLLEHVTNTDIHIQDGERESWNAKIDSSTLDQKLAEKTDKTDFNEHVQDTNLHIGDEISLDDNTTLYINDAGGNVIAKFDASGLNVGDLFLNNQHVATEEYVNDKVTGLFEFKGSISSNAEVPAVHEVGDTYRITVNGEYAGKTCEEGDMLVCIVNGSTANDEDWTVLQQNWTAVDGSSTLKWGEAVTLATIGGVTIDAKLPAISSITSKIATGTNGSTSNITTEVTDPYINHVEGSVVNSSVQFKGANTATVKAKNGVITIDSGITSSEKDKWDEVVNKVDTSVYNAGQKTQNDLISKLFTDKVDTSVYNAGQAALDASISKLFEDKLDKSVYNTDKTALNNTISDISTKVGTKANQTDFEEHINNNDLHLGDEISLDDDSTLYITDKDAKIIVRVDKDGLAASNLLIDDKDVATKEYVNSKVTGLFEFKGSISSSAGVPAVHEVGDAYRINKAGEYVGETCEVGDMLVCIADGSIAKNADWTVMQLNWTAVDGSPILKWDEVVTLATIGGVTIDAKLPDNPNVTSKIATGNNGSTNNTSTEVSNPYINHVEGSIVNSSVQFTGANTATVKAVNGIITIDSGVTSADTSKWNNVVNKVDTSVYNKDKTELDASISELFENKVDTSVYNAGQNVQNASIDKLFADKVDTSSFNDHTRNTSMHLADGERAKWNTVVNKVDTSVYNAGQDAQNELIDKLFTDKVDTSVYDKDKIVLDNTISDISTKVGTKANQTDFEEHITNTDLHLGDEISLEDDSTLYITDKDSAIIAKFTQSGFDAKLIRQDDNVVASNVIVDASTDAPYIDEEGTLHLTATVNGLTIKGTIEPSNFHNSLYFPMASKINDAYVVSRDALSGEFPENAKKGDLWICVKESEIVCDGEKCVPTYPVFNFNGVNLCGPAGKDGTSIAVEDSSYLDVSSKIVNNTNTLYVNVKTQTLEDAISTGVDAGLATAHNVATIIHNNELVVTSALNAFKNKIGLANDLTIDWEGKYEAGTSIIEAIKNINEIGLSTDNYNLNIDFQTTEQDAILGDLNIIYFTSDTNRIIYQGKIFSKEGYIYNASLNSFSTNTASALGIASHAEGHNSVTGGDATTNELIVGTDDTSGAYAHAEGNATIANGISSHSEGKKTFASGDQSHAEGFTSHAQGSSSHAEGYGTTSFGVASHAEGTHSHAEGIGSHAEGANTHAEGSYSHAEGANTHAEGSDSHAEGCRSHAEGLYSHAEGYYTVTTNTAEHTEGKYNVSNTGTRSSIGIGTDENDRKNAFEVMENGDTFIYGVGEYDGTNITTTNTKGERLPASIQEVLPKYNKDRRSICFHYNETDDSLNEAQSDYSFVIGYNNKAIREETDGAGLTLQAANSFVGGMDNRVYHSNCIVFGEGLYTQFGNTFVLGKYNGTVSNQSGWGDTILGIVGDGYKASNGNVTKRNVLLLQGGSDPALHCRGAFKNNASCINDFGEYFEWLDGNPDNEDRIGYMVQLNGNKIELATSVEKCIGVISGTVGFIGGVCAFEWHNKFLRDKWGREIIGEDGNPVINPDYNPELEYIPREQRKEWDVVALVGQVITRQDGTLEVGSYADCSNGIATNATRGFKVLKIIDNEAALLLVK